jgi:hypothetical protein
MEDLKAKGGCSYISELCVMRSDAIRSRIEGCHCTSLLEIVLRCLECSI